MEVTHERNTDSRARNTDGGHYIDYKLFDSLMNALGCRTHMERVRKIKSSRSTYYRVINHEVGVTLRVATQFAKAANTTVNKLFSTQASARPPSSSAPRVKESGLHPVHAEARAQAATRSKPIAGE